MNLSQLKLQGFYVLFSFFWIARIQTLTNFHKTLLDKLSVENISVLLARFKTICYYSNIYIWLFQIFFVNKKITPDIYLRFNCEKLPAETVIP